MKLKTKNAYANQSLQLSVVGEVKLDENASFDCPDEKVEEFMAAQKGSLEFEPLVRKQAKKLDIPELPKTGGADQDAPQDPELLKAAIEDAPLEELQEIALLVPGVKKKDIKGLELEALKTFLLSKI